MNNISEVWVFCINFTKINSLYKKKILLNVILELISLYPLSITIPITL